MPHSSRRCRCLCVSTGCIALLNADATALAGTRALLLETLFTLAQDEWPQVEGPVRAWLARKRAAAVPAQPQGSGVTSACAAYRTPTELDGAIRQLAVRVYLVGERVCHDIGNNDTVISRLTSRCPPLPLYSLACNRVSSPVNVLEQQF